MTHRHPPAAGAPTAPAEGALTQAAYVLFGIVAWTASNTAASPMYEIPINFALPASTKLFITFGTSTGAGTTGFNPLVIAGKY